MELGGCLPAHVRTLKPKLQIFALKTSFCSQNDASNYTGFGEALGTGVFVPPEQISTASVTLGHSNLQFRAH